MLVFRGLQLKISYRKILNCLNSFLKTCSSCLSSSLYFFYFFWRKKSKQKNIVEITRSIVHSSYRLFANLRNWTLSLCRISTFGICVCPHWDYRNLYLLVNGKFSFDTISIDKLSIGLWAIILQKVK